MKSRKTPDRRQLELDFSFDQPSAAAESPAPPPAPSSQPRANRHGADVELTRISRELIAKIGHEDLAQEVKVVWNARLRTTAGRAYRNEKLVELNPALEQLDDAENEVDRTLRHELAHLVAYHRAGKRRIDPHGREWRKACADLGIPGEDRCHDLPFERAQQKRRYVYSCPNCGHQIFRVRKIRRSAACYDCCRNFSGGKFDTRFELSMSLLDDED